MDDDEKKEQILLSHGGVWNTFDAFIEKAEHVELQKLKRRRDWSQESWRKYSLLGKAIKPPPIRKEWWEK